MFCKECGAKFENAKFCPECGTPANNNPMQVTPSVHCPIDGKSDSIQSIPALVAGGNASGTFSGPSGGLTYNNGNVGYYGGSTTLSGALTSDIANALAKPTPPATMGALSLYGWCWIALFSIITIVGPYFVFRALTQKLVKNPEFRKKVFTPGFSAAYILFLVAGAGIEFFPITLLLRKQMNKRLDYPRRYQQWKESCTKWEKLYYCHRCGVVFNPKTNEHFSPDQMHEYLHIDEFE